MGITYKKCAIVLIYFSKHIIKKNINNFIKIKQKNPQKKKKKTWSYLLQPNANNLDPMQLVATILYTPTITIICKIRCY
jgi:hypothetical protein